MDGINNPIIFYSASILIFAFSILAIQFKNIFYSLLSAIVVFFLAGLIFYVLGSEYNAVIQIAIYGIAVPVILGIAIMFTNLRDNNEEKNNPEKKSKLKYLIYLTCGIFILALVYLILTSFIIVPLGFNIEYQINTPSLNSLSAFANGLFVKYVYAFEIISVILTIVVAGLTMFKNKEKSTQILIEESEDK